MYLCNSKVIVEMKRCLLLFVVSICAVAVLFACSGKQETEYYGVSVSAPSLSVLSDESSLNDYLPLFGMSNGLGCDIFRSSASVDSGSNSFAFSSLFLYKDWYLSGADREYLNSIANLSTSLDTSENVMCRSLTNLSNSLQSVDSTLLIVSSIDSSQEGVLRFVQRFEIPLFYDEALQTEKSVFQIDDTSSRELDFFELSGSFMCSFSDNESVVEVPVGNGSYSLLLIMPLRLSLPCYVGAFSEMKYMEIVKSLEKRSFSLRIPDFSDFETEISVSLPYANEFLVPNIHTSCAFNIRKPKEAELHSYKQTLTEKMEQSGSGETLSFERPFVFLLREKSSRAVLLQGVFAR